MLAIDYITTCLHHSREHCSGQSDERRESAAGRQEFRTQKQTKDYMRAFFKMCKDKALPDDVRRFAVEIVVRQDKPSKRHGVALITTFPSPTIPTPQDDCRALEYRQAGDKYWRMAIGNSAWPIGVSAVGLHERGAREKVCPATHVPDAIETQDIPCVWSIMIFMQVGEGQAHVMNDEAARKYITSIKRLITYVPV